MTARALHFHAEEGGADDGALGGHGNVVLRGGGEAGRTTEALAAFLAQQFGDEEIHGFVVLQRLINPPAEGAGVVERRVEDVGVFRQHILPVAHPVISPARIGEEFVDHRRAVRVLLKGGDLFE